MHVHTHRQTQRSQINQPQSNKQTLILPYFPSRNLLTKKKMGILRNIGIFCYVEWGLIHIAAFVIFMMHSRDNDATGLKELYPAIYGGASDELHSSFRAATFPAMSNRLLLQHGFNLGWAGLWSLFAAYVAYKQQPLARYTWLLTVPVLFVDIGYFWAIDTVKLGNAPAEAQTFICSIGSALFVWDLYKQGKIGDKEAIIKVGLVGTISSLTEGGGADDDTL